MNSRGRCHSRERGHLARIALLRTIVRRPRSRRSQRPSPGPGHARFESPFMDIFNTPAAYIGELFRVRKTGYSPNDAFPSSKVMQPLPMRRELPMRALALLAGAHALAMAALTAPDLAGAAAQNLRPAAASVASMPEPATIPERIRAVIRAVCSADDPAPAALTLPLGGAVELSREPLRIRGRAAGTRHSLMLPDGARIRIDRLEPNGILRRVVASYAEPARSGRRPVLLAVADGGCNVVAGRRLTYYEDGMARSIEHLSRDLRAGAARRAVESPGARPGDRRRRALRRSGRARRFRGELPAAGNRLPARPRRGRRPGRLRFLGPRCAPVRRQPRAQRIPSPAPRDPHRVAASGGGAGRGAGSLPLSAP